MDKCISFDTLSWKPVSKTASLHPFSWISERWQAGLQSRVYSIITDTDHRGILIHRFTSAWATQWSICWEVEAGSPDKWGIALVQLMEKLPVIKNTVRASALRCQQHTSWLPLLNNPPTLDQQSCVWGRCSLKQIPNTSETSDKICKILKTIRIWPGLGHCVE